MKNSSLIYEIKCEAEYLTTITPEFKNKREVFFQAGSFLFEKNSFFTFLLPTKTGFWLVYYGQPKPNSNLGRHDAQAYLNQSLSNCVVTQFAVKNSKGVEKTFRMMALSSIVNLFKKFEKSARRRLQAAVKPLITPLYGEDQLIFDIWFAAFHKKKNANYALVS